MSRIGRMPVVVPSGVDVAIDGSLVTVKGPKGTLSHTVVTPITVEKNDGVLTVTRPDDERDSRARHGLTRTLVNNMVVGVSKGFSKKLEINGVGYRVAMQGTDLKFNLGFSHDVIFKLPQGITAAIEQNKITISGIDKQQVGQVAAEIRALKKPEPYKGKGIKYADERIIRKSGKSGKDK